MTRFLFRAMDFGASVIFMALCAKAFCVHFYKDIAQQLDRRKLPTVAGPSLIPPDGVVPKPLPVVSVRDRSAVTAGKIHHSPYCLYYQPKRGGTIKDGTFEFCPSGSANAD